MTTASRGLSAQGQPLKHKYRPRCSSAISRPVRARARVMGFYKKRPRQPRKARTCARHGVLQNGDRYPLHENRTCMLRGSMSGKALVSADARARPVAARAAPEAQIPTEVPRQDPSRSAVHHEGRARQAPVPIPWRKIDRSPNGCWPRQDSRSSATALEGVPVTESAVVSVSRHFQICKSPALGPGRPCKR
jgi:hypothetical protein